MMQRRACRLRPAATPLYFSLLLFLFMCHTHVAAQSPANATAPREAYVTLLYGDFYVLPVRVMMRSLLVNSPDVASGLRERLVIVTGSTSEEAVEQMRKEGITVRLVPPVTSPYTGDDKFRSRFVNVLTKLYVFKMTEYTRLAFIDADSLVLRDLSALFSCGVFCAAFINPCYFNTGFMLITPNTTVFEHMQKVLPHTPSYDGGDQGFLNAYFPAMLDAPMFDPATPPSPRPPLSRLPFNWHVDHSSYFPTSAFEFEKSDRCGVRRNMEWLGPPIAKPWLWWTYSVFDLSWDWNQYRRQLRDPYPPHMGSRRNGLLLIAMCYVAIFGLSRGFSARTSRPFLLARVLPRLCPFPNASPTLSALYPVLAGFALWAMGFVLCGWAVPLILPPYPAVVVFFHLRILHSLSVLVLGGLIFCVGQKQPGRVRLVDPIKARGLPKAFRDMLSWAVFDAAFLIVCAFILWQVTFHSMFVKAAVVIFCVFWQAVLVSFMLARTYLMWLRVTEGSWSADVMT